MRPVAIFAQSNHTSFTLWSFTHYSHGSSSSHGEKPHQTHLCGMERRPLERRHFNRWWPIFRVFIAFRDLSSHKSTIRCKSVVTRILEALSVRSLLLGAQSSVLHDCTMTEVHYFWTFPIPNHTSPCPVYSVVLKFTLSFTFSESPLYFATTCFNINFCEFEFGKIAVTSK